VTPAVCHQRPRILGGGRIAADKLIEKLDLLKKSAASGNVNGSAPVPVTEGVKPANGTGGVADLN
jgi:hypothetical protein